MRRSNGTGAVYKLSGNRRKPWIARITTGWEKEDEENQGRQLFRTIGYYAKKSEAELALAAQMLNPNIIPRPNLTFQGLYDEWSKPRYEYLSRQTQDNYKAGWKHLSKYGPQKFADLRTSHLQDIINYLHRDGKSRSTMEKVKIVANQLYDYAVQNDICNKNYAEFIKLPKVEKEEKEIFTDPEIKLLEKNKGKPWVDTILILIYTGFRVNEMLTLTKFNVDLGKQIIIGGSKTEAGKRRVVPIHPKILPIIKKYYDKAIDRLFTRKNASISPNYYRRFLYIPALDELKIRPLNPHSCRHTCISLMNKNGANKTAIQRIVGHVNYNTTSDYTHPEIEELRKAINAMK